MSLIDYLDRFVSFSQKAKEKREEDESFYYKKIFSYLKASNSDIQTVYEEYITEAVKSNDFGRLQSIFLHSVRVRMLPEGASGYDHCDRLWLLLDLLACDDFDNIYRVLPRGLPISANGYPMYVNGTNIVLCLLYNKENNITYPVDKIIEKAEKFAASKKPLWERSVISCLLGILQEDVSRISDSLQQVCTGFAKTDTAKYQKIQCQNAYGLLVLAKHFLREEKLEQIKYPEYKNFSSNYMKWLLEQSVLPKKLCITYDPPMEEINEILTRPIAVTRIYQPYLNSDSSYLSAREKKAYYMDLGTMLTEFLQ